MDDIVVRKFFRMIDEYVVCKFTQPGTKLTRKGMSRGKRFAPILLVAEKLKLFEHIEDESVRGHILPGLVFGFKVARRNDKISHTRDSEQLLGYDLDDDGNCRFTFRHHARDAAAKGGAPGRAKGKKNVGQHMEPTVYLEKYDPHTGEVISKDDKDIEGHWRAFMVTFPLVKPVQGVQVSEVAYPNERSPFSDWMTVSEIGQRDSLL